jgi:ubiquinone/menaquinone biosynthesis C-methylase UbiE
LLFPGPFTANPPYAQHMADPADPDWRSQILEADKPGPDAVRTYSRLAPVYEIWARLTESKARSRVMELAGPVDGEAVLEIATGTGVQLLGLASRNQSGRTVGIELAGPMLEQARRRLESAGLSDQVELKQADALDLPFEEQSFDLVTNSYMLDLMSRDEIPKALGEMKRVLRPGGRLVLSNMTKAERASHGIWDWLYGHGLGVTANCRGVLASPVLAELGFTGIHREYLSQMAFPTEIVTARRPDSD